MAARIALLETDRMDVTVTETHDPAAAFALVGGFLAAQPILNNLALTILHQAVDYSLDGTFWTVHNERAIVGVGLQSPPDQRLVLTPMPAPTVGRLVAAIERSLPGVRGEAHTASAFAKHWTERRSVTVTNIEGQRLYRLSRIRPAAPAPGHLRRATRDDVATLAEWSQVVNDETGDASEDVDQFLRDGWFAKGLHGFGVTMVQPRWLAPSSRRQALPVSAVSTRLPVCAVRDTPRPVSRGSANALWNNTNSAFCTRNSVTRPQTRSTNGSATSRWLT